MSKNDVISVVLVDDHQFILDMLPLYFEQFHDVDLVGTARTQGECLELMNTITPDLFIVDFNLDGNSSVFLVRKIKERCPQSKVLGYSGLDDPYYIKQMLYAGANGFVSKNVSSDTIYTAIKEIHSGRIYTSDDIAEKLLRADTETASHEQLSSLSARELEILKGIAYGHKLKNLASDLNISPNTLQVYKTRIYKKLGLATDVDICRFAVKHKLVKL